MSHNAGIRLKNKIRVEGQGMERFAFAKASTFARATARQAGATGEKAEHAAVFSGLGFKHNAVIGSIGNF